MLGAGEYRVDRVGWLWVWGFEWVYLCVTSLWRFGRMKSCVAHAKEPSATLIITENKTMVAKGQGEDKRGY